MSALKLCFLIQAVLIVSVSAQTPSEQNSPLPSQAKQVHGVAVPVPKEIFRSLDQFRDANWAATKRPESYCNWSRDRSQSGLFSRRFGDCIAAMGKAIINAVLAPSPAMGTRTQIAVVLSALSLACPLFCMRSLRADFLQRSAAIGFCFAKNCQSIF